MRRFSARLEIARDNMRHSGSPGSITFHVYSKTWWDERVDAVSRIVDAVFPEPGNAEDKSTPTPMKAIPKADEIKEWEPF